MRRSLARGVDPSPCARRRRDCFLIPRQEPPPPPRGGRFTAAIGDLPVVRLRIGRNRQKKSDAESKRYKCFTQERPFP